MRLIPRRQLDLKNPTRSIGSTYVVVLDGENDKSVGILGEEWFGSKFSAFFLKLVVRLDNGGLSSRCDRGWGNRKGFGDASLVIGQDTRIGIPDLSGCFKGVGSWLVFDDIVGRESAEFLFESRNRHGV